MSTTSLPYQADQADQADRPPRGAQSPRRVRDATLALPPLGMSLCRFVQAEMLGAASQLAREGEEVHTGIHQARKRLRRVRATLALGRKVLGDPGRRLDLQLRQFCRGLSPLRDAHALIEGLERLAQVDTVEHAPLREAIDWARQRRDLQLQAALARDPGFGRRQQRLRELAARLERLDWNRMQERTVADAVERSEKRLDRARRRVQKVPGDEERWHTLRRRFRRLRQQDDLLARERPRLRPDRPVSAEEASTLGEAQDDALILRRCGRHSPFPPPLKPLLRRSARERLAKARRRTLSSLS